MPACVAPRGPAYTNGQAACAVPAAWRDASRGAAS
ncbi:hypothetical protein FEP28_02856 [Burkholderia multivorans]|nr:hypothetical protein [Burkholderia multivorans]MDR9066097.1 hypothetical protein [Burkholderia multivorans]MDR9081487.1 hypothetical protein [Burkholderia multivorans]MDR9095969.1 hypothetical protein [Burkholderia multivorans]MDR9099926.1 hypothetical protein [Burkholderia multivorans]